MSDDIPPLPLMAASNDYCARPLTDVELWRTFHEAAATASTTGSLTLLGLRAVADAVERAARAAEREACARICDKYALDSGVARAIRARAEGQR